MKGGTLFSGIGAPELAAPEVDWRWCAETEPFAAAVLDHHFGTQNLGDVNEVGWDAVEPVDLMVFGSPCQSFSVAGKRLGLDDPRGNLALVGLRAVSRVRPRWVVFENVPGLLSSDEGRDFGAFLGLLAECGYGFAYRVLDAQYLGVPQRRRRLFVVAHLADWRPAAAVLFEPESLRGDPPPGRAPRQGVAGSLSSRATAGGGVGTDFECGGGFVAYGGNNTRGPIDLATARNAHGGPHGRLDFESETFVTGRFEQDSMAGRGTLGWNGGDEPLRPVKPQAGHQMVVTHSLNAHSAGQVTEDGTGRGTPLIAFGGNNHSRPIETATAMNPDAAKPGGAFFEHNTLIAFTANDSGGDASNIAPTLRSGNHDKSHANAGVMLGIASNMAVRRLTPTECERLQGFPDNFTNIPFRNKPAADGPRYRALGNAMAVPCIKWITDRITQF